MSTAIIVVILLIVVAFALRGTLQHFKGEGGCCGTGRTVKAKAKKLEGPVIGRKIVEIQGMSCENCKNNVERAVNDIDGAACKVDLKAGTAEVSYDKEIDEGAVKAAIERLNYTVVSITNS